jgi:hypothetical protein
LELNEELSFFDKQPLCGGHRSMTAKRSRKRF